MLNSLLNLTPLTLVEVASRAVMREAFRNPSGGRFECPYWFFQHLDADGMLVVAGPGGHEAKLSAIDVMNLIPREPVKVMAMPLATFMQRLSLDPIARHKTLTADCYEPASVMAARRERRGDFSYTVWFDRAELNASTTFTAPLMDGEARRIKPLTRRANMPIRNMTSPSNWSADNAAALIGRVHSRRATSFLDAALRQNTARTSRLAALDAAIQL